MNFISIKDMYKFFSKIPVIKTERFFLRKISYEDTDDMYEYSCEARTSEYLLWSPHPERFYTYEYIRSLQNAYKHGEFYDWAIICRDSGKMIGTVGYSEIYFEDDRAEVGYVINPEYWGRGVATECLSAITAFGFERLGFHRLEARIMVGNDASMRVAEKCGYAFEGVHKDMLLVKGEYRDIAFYANVK